MSVKLIKIRTIIDFFLLNSNLSQDQLMKRINELISIHNKQVKQGKLAEDIMVQLNAAEQLVLIKNIKKRIYEHFEGTDIEDIMKARYRERGNYTYIACALHMSQGKYYYMMNKVYNLFIVELYYLGLIKSEHLDNCLLFFRIFFSRIKKIIINEGGNRKIYSKFDLRFHENVIILELHERLIQLVF